MGPKRVYKVRNGIFCGVCGGLGEYLNVDPVIIRILWLAFGFTGAGFFAYIIAAAIMPFKDEV